MFAEFFVDYLLTICLSTLFTGPRKKQVNINCEWHNTTCDLLLERIQFAQMNFHKHKPQKCKKYLQTQKNLFSSVSLSFFVSRSKCVCVCVCVLSFSHNSHINPFVILQSKRENVVINPVQAQLWSLKELLCQQRREIIVFYSTILFRGLLMFSGKIKYLSVYNCFDVTHSFILFYPTVFTYT